MIKYLNKFEEDKSARILVKRLEQYWTIIMENEWRKKKNIYAYGGVGDYKIKYNVTYNVTSNDNDREDDFEYSDYNELLAYKNLNQMFGR